MKLLRIFTPHTLSRFQRARDRNQRFVHYTSAQVAKSIIENDEVWMRNASVMNDFEEINYGWELLCAAYRGHNKEKLLRLFEGKFPNLCDTIESYANNEISFLKNHSYLTCISEHDAKENVYGRLSMWRAYGGLNSVCFVLNGKRFLEASDALGAYTLPVQYLDRKGFLKRFSRIIDGIVSNGEYILSLEESIITTLLNSLFRSFVLATKHPGFLEEREWRVYFNSSLNASNIIKESIECVRGVPQIVKKIPLKEFPEHGFVGASLQNILDRVIIGPTEFPAQIYAAFVDLLSKKGISDASRKVVVSSIPLREI